METLNPRDLPVPSPTTLYLDLYAAEPDQLPDPPEGLGVWLLDHADHNGFPVVRVGVLEPVSSHDELLLLRLLRDYARANWSVQWPDSLCRDYCPLVGISGRIESVKRDAEAVARGVVPPVGTRVRLDAVEAYPEATGVVVHSGADWIGVDLDEESLERLREAYEDDEDVYPPETPYTEISMPNNYVHWD